MNQLVVMSGKGGPCKRSIVVAFAALAKRRCSLIAEVISLDGVKSFWIKNWICRRGRVPSIL